MQSPIWKGRFVNCKEIGRFCDRTRFNPKPVINRAAFGDAAGYANLLLEEVLDGI